MPKILVPLAEGFEEIEAMAIIDILRRGGIEVFIVGAPGKFIKGGHNVTVHSDGSFDHIDANKYDGIVLPGGSPGYENLMRNQNVIDIVRNYVKQGKLVAAICAAPMVLVKAGVLKDKKATCYPGFEKELDMPRGEKVVVDGNIITSQGPGTAMEFGLKLVEILVGKDKADRLRQGLLVS